MSIRLSVSGLLMALVVSVPAMATEQQYSVTSFDTVRMQGPFSVVIVTGKGNTARGVGDRDALDRVSLDVSGGVLTIRAAPPRFAQADGNSGRVTLYITTSTVRRVLMGGSGALRIEGLKGVRGDLNLAGSGELEVSGVAVDELVVNSAGNGRVRLGGVAGSARIQVIGAGSIDAPQLVAKAVVIDTRGRAALP